MKIGTIKLDNAQESIGEITLVKGRLLVDGHDITDCPQRIGRTEAVRQVVAMYGYRLAKPSQRVWKLRLTRSALMTARNLGIW